MGCKTSKRTLQWLDPPPTKRTCLEDQQNPERNWPKEYDTSSNSILLMQNIDELDYLTMKSLLIKLAQDPNLPNLSTDIHHEANDMNRKRQQEIIWFSHHTTKIWSQLKTILDNIWEGPAGFPQAYHASDQNESQIATAWAKIDDTLTRINNKCQPNSKFRDQTKHP